MAQTIPLTKLVLGLLLPLSEKHELDPFVLKSYSKASVERIVWTVESRTLELFARLSHRSILGIVREIRPEHTSFERGAPIDDTAVTFCQTELLVAGLGYSNCVTGDIVEVGSYRGVTTTYLAGATSKIVYAVDPFIGYGGSETDYVRFLDRTNGAKNIRHVRKPSGEAAKAFADNSLSLVFIDAIHDVSNSWFDFVTWSRRVAPGGLIALHDVDDHPGVGLTCRRIINRGLPFSVWGYSPNLMIFKKA